MSMHGFLSYKQIIGSTKILENNLTAGTYQNSKLLFQVIMRSLNLTPKEYFDRVYFLNFRATSLNRLKYAYSEGDFYQVDSGLYEEKPCYFIFDEQGHLLLENGLLLMKKTY